MAVTQASLRTAVRLRVEASEPRLRPYQTLLTNSPGAGGTTFSVGDGDAWEAGDLIEGPLGELSIVVSKSTNDLTVRRAVGQVAAETAAADDLMRKNPRFSIDQIDAEINASLRALRGNGLYELATEQVTYNRGEDWYDVTDTAMEKVIAVWYVDSDSDFRVPFFQFKTDPRAAQPKLWLSASQYSGAIDVMYRKPYAAVTDLSDIVGDIVAYETVYKLMGIANVGSTADPGKRTDRTSQGGQEGRDSIWYLREFIRLRDLEIARLAKAEREPPSHPRGKRASRFVS